MLSSKLLPVVLLKWTIGENYSSKKEKFLKYKKIIGKSEFHKIQKIYWDLFYICVFITNGCI